MPINEVHYFEAVCSNHTLRRSPTIWRRRLDTREEAEALMAEHLRVERNIPAIRPVR